VKFSQKVNSICEPTIYTFNFFESIFRVGDSTYIAKHPEMLYYTEYDTHDILIHFQFEWTVTMKLLKTKQTINIHKCERIKRIKPNPSTKINSFHILLYMYNTLIYSQFTFFERLLLNTKERYV
jgi:hypothetical protein